MTYTAPELTHLDTRIVPPAERFTKTNPADAGNLELDHKVVSVPKHTTMVSASAIDRPPARAWIRPAAKASPAPVVSTGWTLRAMSMTVPRTRLERLPVIV